MPAVPEPTVVKTDMREIYLAAREAANQAVIASFGEEYLPVVPGTNPHRHWLHHFDLHMESGARAKGII